MFDQDKEIFRADLTAPEQRPFFFLAHAKAVFIYRGGLEMRAIAPRIVRPHSSCLPRKELS